MAEQVERVQCIACGAVLPNTLAETLDDAMMEHVRGRHSERAESNTCFRPYDQQEPRRG